MSRFEEVISGNRTREVHFGWTCFHVGSKEKFPGIEFTCQQCHTTTTWIAGANGFSKTPVLNCCRVGKQEIFPTDTRAQEHLHSKPVFENALDAKFVSTPWDGTKKQSNPRLGRPAFDEDAGDGYGNAKVSYSQHDPDFL